MLISIENYMNDNQKANEKDSCTKKYIFMACNLGEKFIDSIAVAIIYKF